MIRPKDLPHVILSDLPLRPGPQPGDQDRSYRDQPSARELALMRRIAELEGELAKHQCAAPNPRSCVWADPPPATRPKSK